MSTLVLDSSVALKWVLPESDSPQAIALRDEFLRQIHELLAPDVFPIEVAHALAKAERRNLLVAPEGQQRLMRVMSTPPQLRPYLPLLPRAFEIASAARIGVYDCLYIALAEQEQCEFVTADVRLINNLKPQFPFIVDLASR